MNTIPASELILNPRGAVYHLDLLPEEIAHEIILVGDPDRVPQVSRHFDRIETRRQTREFITHTGIKSGKPITVISTGIGTDNIDIVLSELDALANIDFHTRTVREAPVSLRFFRAGTSGALRNEIEVDSVLVSSHGLGLDNLMNFYDYPVRADELRLVNDFNNYMNFEPGFANPYLTAADPDLLKTFGELVSGVTVTCPGFYGPQGRVVRGELKYPAMIDRLSGFESDGHRITNFEMETAGIYGMSRMLGHQAVSLNAILANRAKKEFSVKPKKVVDEMIEMLIGKILQLPGVKGA